MGSSEKPTRSLMSRRQLLQMAAYGTLGAALAACGANAPSQPSAGGAAQSGATTAPAAPGTAQQSVELSFLSHVYEPWNNALAAQMEQYGKDNPNVKVQYSYVQHADLNAKIVTSIAGGSPPDIMGVYGPWMPQFIEGGTLAAAPEWVTQDLDANFPAIMRESATYDGKVYGYVQHIGIPTPVVNLQLYEAAGVQPPTTYDELLATSKQLEKRDAAGNITQYGTTLSASKGGSWNVIHYGTILMAHGGAFLNADNTKAALNTPVAVQAAEIYKQLTHPQAPDDVFPLKRSAMTWSGPWLKSSLAQVAPDLRYKAIVPIKGPASQVTGSYTWFWAVSAKASPEKQEAAWKLLQWMSAPNQYGQVYRAVGLLPITKQLPAELASDEWVQTYNEALSFAKLYYAKHSRWEQIDLAIGEELERLAAGEITPEQFTTTANERVDGVLSKSG